MEHTQIAEGIEIHWDESSPFGARPEAVLRLVLDRVEYLQGKLPCYENEVILGHLKEAVRWEELRNERRAAQKVKGTPKPHISGDS